VPYESLLTEGKLLPEKELGRVFTEADVDTTRKSVVFSSQGIGACLVDLALRTLENENIKLYEGSWNEYGRYDEPDFSKGNPDKTVDMLMKSYYNTLGEEAYRGYLGAQEFMIKMKKKEDEKKRE